MIDYFQHQIDRSIGRLPAIRPRLPSLYEPEDLKDGPGRLFPKEWQAAETIPVHNRMQSPEPTAAAPVQERSHEGGQGLLREEMPGRPVSDGDAASVRTPSLRPVPAPEMPPAAVDAFRQSGRPALISSPNADAVPARNEFAMDRGAVGESQSGVAKRKEFRQKTTVPTGETHPKDYLPPQGGFAPDLAVSPTDSPPVMRDNRGLPDPIGREITHGERKGPSKRVVNGQVQGPHVIQSSSKPQSSPPEQTIRVTIGRIDVRAIMPPPTAVQHKPTPPQPKVTLEEYLKKQWGGRR